MIEVYAATGNKKQLVELPADARSNRVNGVEDMPMQPNPDLHFAELRPDISAIKNSELARRSSRMSDSPAGNDTRDLSHRHRQMLTIAGAVGVLAFVLQELPDGRVSLRGLPQIPLPQTCFSRSWLGVKCPGCGLTRSIIHFAEGNWRASWRVHRLGGLVALVIAFQIPYRLLALCRPNVAVIPGHWLVVFAYLLLALLIVSWLVDVVAGRVISA